MRYTHTNIISLDWKRLVEFYIQVFECKIVPPIRNQSGSWLSTGTGVPNANLEGAHLLLPGYGEDGPTLEIYQYSTVENLSPVKPNTRGFGHLAFEVQNVEETLNKMVAHGGKKYGEITSRNIHGVGRISFVYASDPEGNLIELQNWKRGIVEHQNEVKT